MAVAVWVQVPSFAPNSLNKKVIWYKKIKMELSQMIRILSSAPIVLGKIVWNKKNKEYNRKSFKLLSLGNKKSTFLGWK